MIGIDEAGRGPAVGPMLIAAVALTPEQLESVRQFANDSKCLRRSKLGRLDALIRSACKAVTVEEASASTISDRMEAGESLNDIELAKMAECLSQTAAALPPCHVLVEADAIGNVERQRNALCRALVEARQCQGVRVEPKADRHRVSASCASVVAKAARERRMMELQMACSGYPSDWRTIRFIRECAQNGVDPSEHSLRRTWKTVRREYGCLP